MRRPRTTRSTIKNDPFAAVIPLAPSEPPPAKPARVREPVATQPATANADAPPPAPAPISHPKRRQKLTVHLDGALVERVKNAAYWNPRLTIARIAEQGIRAALEKVEKENGGPYPERESELVGGRPIK